MRVASKSRPATWRRSPIRRWSIRSSKDSFVRWMRANVARAAAVLERSLATLRFSELTSAVRGHGWARAIAFGLLGRRALGAAALRHAEHRAAPFRDSSRRRIPAGRERLARSAAGHAAGRKLCRDFRRSARGRTICHARAAAARVYAAAVPTAQRRADDRARRRRSRWERAASPGRRHAYPDSRVRTRRCRRTSSILRTRRTAPSCRSSASGPFEMRPT